MSKEMNKDSRFFFTAMILFLLIFLLLPTVIIINIYWVPSDYHHLTAFAYGLFVFASGIWMVVRWPNDQENEKKTGLQVEKGISSVPPVMEEENPEPLLINDEEISRMEITSYRYPRLEFEGVTPFQVFKKILNPKWQLPSGISPVITKIKPAYVNIFTGNSQKLNPYRKVFAIKSGNANFYCYPDGLLENAEWIEHLSTAEVLEAYVSREQAKCPHADRILRLVYKYHGRYYCYGDDVRNDLTVIYNMGLECSDCGGLVFIDSRFEQRHEEIEGPWWGYADIYLLSMRMWDYFMEKYNVSEEERSKVPVEISHSDWYMAD